VAAKPAATAQQMQKPRRDKLCWWTKDMRNPLVDLDGFFSAVGKLVASQTPRIIIHRASAARRGLLLLRHSCRFMLLS